MTISIDIRARHLLGAGVVAIGVVLAGWWMTPAHSQSAGPEPVDSFAFVARADNPVDALAASSAAGQLGAPVYLTGSGALDEQARQGLVDTDPQVVVLAGGPVALSATVEDQVRALLPAAQVRRFGGGDRTETARLIGELTGQLGVARPLLAGATVSGDAGITGELTVDGVQVAATLADLTARIDGLEADLAAANGRIGSLEATLAGVTRDDDTLVLSGMNVQIVNGENSTTTSNGLGNLIVGYNAPRSGGTATDRAGSHYVIVGNEHHWTSFGGIIAGFRNTGSGPFASVTGGSSNTASGVQSSVSGGQGNAASGGLSSVSGGQRNTASSAFASVSGGSNNSASGNSASVTGGDRNIASNGAASVSGGDRNTASGTFSSVSGGGLNIASGSDSSVAGGIDNTSSGVATSVAGGMNGTVSNSVDSLIGNMPFPDS